jgi:chromosome segregation ATPase
MLSQAFSSSRKSEEDIGLIYKQQHELQLLMAELRDRDKELNETVAAHRKQLDAWDADRQKILKLEEKYARCRKDIQSKNSYISHLESRVLSLEEREHSHSQELETTQVELKQAHIQTDQASKEFQKLKSHQQSLQKSIKILKEREESLNKDLLARNGEVAEKVDACFKLEKTCSELEGKLKMCEKAESLLRQEVAAQRELISESRQEQERLKSQNEIYVHEITSLKEQLSQTRESYANLENELQLAGERDQRKEQLLSLQRTKQQRCNTELSNIRQLYDRQQRELELLRLNLSSTQEQMAKQEEELSLHRHSPLHPTLMKQSPEHMRKSPSTSNGHTKLTITSKHHDKLGSNSQDRRHPCITTGEQQELSEPATETGDRLATVLRCDSPPAQADMDTNDVDDASSVASFPELPTMGMADFNASSRLQELLTESENLTKELNACQWSQATGTAAD